MTGDYIMSPKRILDEAHALQAERIVFWRNGEFRFPKIQVHSIEDTILELGYIGVKYKFQKKEDKKFVDISAYKPGLDVNTLIREVSSITFDQQVNVLPEFWGVLAELLNSKFRPKAISIFRKLLYNFCTAQYSKYSKMRMANCRRFIATAPEELRQDKHVRYFLEYIGLFCASIEFIEQQHILKYIPDAGELGTVINSFINNLQSNCPVALSNIKGQLASLFDRDLAAAYFEDVLEYKDLINDFYLDFGALTYFSGNEVEKQGGSDIVNNVIAHHEYYIQPSLSGLSAVISFDLHFARAYLPLLMQYVSHIDEINFHFIFIGDKKERRVFTKLLKMFRSAYLVATGKKNIANLSVSFMSVPNWVTDIRTFYACARFFIARELLNRFDSIYIMDADVHIERDPRPYFKKLVTSPFPLALPVSGSRSYMAPWRRVMAGNVYLKNDLRARDFLDDVLKYLVVGLQQKYSWMLDQNALCFAIERSDIHYLDLRGIKRPIYQPRINKLYEGGVK